MKWVGAAKASFWLNLKRRRAETEGGTVYLSLCSPPGCRDLLVIDGPSGNGVATPSTTFHAPLRLPTTSSQAGPYTADLEKNHSARDRSLANTSMWKGYYFRPLIFIAHCFGTLVVLKVSFQANSISKLAEISRHFPRLDMIQRSGPGIFDSSVLIM
jgi:hypothetical protein